MNGDARPRENDLEASGVGAGEHESPPVRFDERPRQRQPETGRARGGNVTLEDLLAQLGGNAGSVVFNGQHAAPVGGRGHQAGGSAPMGHRVLEQHIERLSDAARADARGQRRFDFGLQLAPSARIQRRPPGGVLARQRGQVDVARSADVARAGQL